MRALLRWAGSKLSTLDQLRAHAPSKFLTYVEPFCGSAALYFYMEPDSAVLSDVNGDLISFYQEFKKDCVLIQACADALSRDSVTYYKLRAHMKDCSCPFERAVIFFYLNRNCFNGLFRTDRDGNFNVPFAGTKTGELPDALRCLEASRLLATADVIRDDFENVVHRYAARGSFFFLDPPYAIAHRRPFTDYTAKGFTALDLTRLLGCLEAIDDAGGSFVMTYDAAAADRIKLRDGWHQHRLVVRRNISGFATGRRQSTEVVTVNVQ